MAARDRGRRAAEGVTKPYCYHIHQFEELRPVLLDVVEYGQELGLDMSYGDHEDAPGQLELNFRFDRPVRTADNITTYRQVCAAVGRKHGLLPTLHAQAVHRRLGQRRTTTTSRWSTTRATTSSTTPTARRSSPRSRATSSAGCSSTSAR